MNKPNLSDNQIIDILNQQKPEMDNDWQRSTEQKLTELTNSDVTFYDRLRTEWRTLIFNFTAVTRKRALMFGVLAVLSIGLIGGGLWGYNYLKNRPLSAEQQREILAKIIANNASTAIRSPQTEALETTTLSARSAGGTADLAADAQILPLFPPVATDYNYRYSKNTYTRGQAADKCLAFGAAGENNQYESYEFNDQQGTSYYKSISSDSNGQLITYSLNKNTTTGNEYYEYRGGQFAVKTVYTYDANMLRATDGGAGTSGQSVDGAEPTVAPDAPVVDVPTDTPADTPVSPETPTSTEPTPADDLIKQYFGDNAQVQSVQQEGGQEYYVIQYSFPVNCNEAIYLYRAADSTASNATFTNNVIYVSWVSSKDFIVYKTFSYLDSVSDTNLIDSTLQTGETRTTDFASVASNFNFDYNVPVRTLDTSLLSTTPEEDAKNTADYLATLNVDVLLLNHPSLKVNSIYSYNPEPKIPEGWDYYTDRAYYPAGTKGDEMYAQATTKTEFNRDYVSSLVSVSTYNETNYQYFSMEGYANTYTDAQLLENRFSEHTVENQQNLSWTVDGQPVTAVLYTVKVKSWAIPIAAEDSARSAIMPVEPGYACEGDDCSYTEKVITLAHGSTRYLIGLTPELDVNSLQFDSYNTQNAADMQFLRSKILELRLDTASAESRAAASKEASY